MINLLVLFIDGLVDHFSNLIQKFKLNERKEREKYYLIIIEKSFQMDVLGYFLKQFAYSENNSYRSCNPVEF